jgi:hypothetical protein
VTEVAEEIEEEIHENVQMVEDIVIESSINIT